MNNQMTLCGIIILAIALMVAGCTAMPPRALTLQQMHDDYDYMCKVIDEVFPGDKVNRQVYDINIKETLARYRSRITGEETPQQFYELVSRALYACKGNHLWTTPILAGIRTRLFWWSWLPEELYANSIDNDAIDITWAYARASQTEIRSTPGIPLLYYKGNYYSKYPFKFTDQIYGPGMKLLAINDNSPQVLIRTLQDQLDCFDYEYRQFYGSMFHKQVGDDFYMLLGNIDLDFEFEDSNHQIQKISVKAGEQVECQIPLTPLLASVPMVEMMEDSGVLYIRLPEMSAANQDFILKELNRFKNTDAIKAVVLDVRHNRGGNDGVWLAILSKLTGYDIKLRGELAYRNSEMVRARLMAENKTQITAEKISFLDDESFLVNCYDATIFAGSESMHLKVPYFIITGDVYSSTGGLLSLANTNEFITRVGIRNPTSLGKAGTPWFFVLPNSQIIFSLRPSLDITNCRTPEDTLHCDVDIEVDASLSSMLRFLNTSKDESSLETYLEQYDPYFITICEALKGNDKN